MKQSKNNKRIAIVPGSFDPVTAGHFDVIKTAAGLFDEVYAAVCVNGEKAGIFSAEQRLDILKTACVAEGFGNVNVELCGGLMSDYMAERGIKYIVKGVRNGSDFDYEYTLSQIMRTFCSDFETIILPAKSIYQHVSSTYVRELLKYGCSVLTDAVPVGTAQIILKYYTENK